MPVDRGRFARLAGRLARSLRCAWKTVCGCRRHIHVENRWRLGDEVLAIPFYQLLRRRYPSACISVSVNHPGLLRSLRDSIEPMSRDLDEMACDRYLFLREDPRGCQRLQGLCSRFRIPCEPIEPAVEVDPALAAAAAAQARQVVRSGPVIACSSGTGWACKSWPLGRYQQWLGALRERLPGVTVVELGRACERIGADLDLRDRTSVEEAAAWLDRADLYVGADSGLVHLALAVGTPVVGLYGPVDPVRSFGRRTRLRPLLTDAPCGGCWTDLRMKTAAVCPLGAAGRDAEGYACMCAIGVDRVLDASLDALEQTIGPRELRRR